MKTLRPQGFYFISREPCKLFIIGITLFKYIFCVYIRPTTKGQNLGFQLKLKIIYKNNRCCLINLSTKILSSNYKFKCIMDDRK